MKKKRTKKTKYRTLRQKESLFTVPDSRNNDGDSKPAESSVYCFVEGTIYSGSTWICWNSTQYHRSRMLDSWAIVFQQDGVPPHTI
jgi:hypothetical protein